MQKVARNMKSSLESCSYKNLIFHLVVFNEHTKSDNSDNNKASSIFSILLYCVACQFPYRESRNEKKVVFPQKENRKTGFQIVVGQQKKGPKGQNNRVLRIDMLLGCTLGQGCVAGTLKPVLYTRPCSAEFCNPLPDQTPKIPTLSQACCFKNCITIQCF